MSPQSPFSRVGAGFDRLASSLRPPAWLTDELQHRLVLFLNHVLMQEPQARERLARRQGQVVRVQWGPAALQLAITPAGLCERAPAAEHDLLLTVVDASPLALARDVLRGERPAVRIEGDSQLAGDVNWLVDHVRWDAEEDLARVVGDAPAHALAELGRALARGLRQFVGRLPSRDRSPPR